MGGTTGNAAVTAHSFDGLTRRIAEHHGQAEPAEHIGARKIRKTESKQWVGAVARSQLPQLGHVSDLDPAIGIFKIAATYTCFAKQFIGIKPFRLKTGKDETCPTGNRGKVCDGSSFCHCRNFTKDWRRSTSFSWLRPYIIFSLS